ncbi:hypothetical protein EJP77_11550 [Paenibacillus zeisoli]|uniref:Uncharacterized protein n=1 Tax=Paenibacillus zeisoli TaxID=2496267 RepID=A0A3S1D523_9BACL|nr:hypothetical protein [Paenibacillus zeisoli]RUT30469.1 hypothetical protein EJP77_11550 [Paenibacillus zeisoli]
MSKFKSELTRRYLLNSNSREVKDEVVKNNQDVELGQDIDAVSDVRAVRGADHDRNLVIGANVEFASEAEASGELEGESSALHNDIFLSNWDGKEKTHEFYRRSYE